jgi:hypothetical protein
MFSDDVAEMAAIPARYGAMRDPAQRDVPVLREASCLQGLCEAAAEQREEGEGTSAAEDGAVLVGNGAIEEGLRVECGCRCGCGGSRRRGGCCC